jgi:hypothetical protein
MHTDTSNRTHRLEKLWLRCRNRFAWMNRRRSLQTFAAVLAVLWLKCSKTTDFICSRREKYGPAHELAEDLSDFVSLFLK